MSQDVDLIINARWIIPIEPANTVLENCALVIHQGKILNCLPQAQADRDFRAQQVKNLDQHVLLPGLINCHGHAAMSLLRGYADDKPLQEWLEQHIWPAEGRWIDADFVRDGTALACAEMIRNGTSCFSDMYFFPEQAAEVALELGLRAQLSFPIFDFPSAWGKDAEEYLQKGLKLADQYRSSDTIKIAFGPHAPYTVNEDMLKRIAVLAEETQRPIQIHLHETAFEVERSLEQYQQRPIARLAKLGLLSPLTQCVHMTQLNDEDITLIKQHGAHVIHCPESNLKLASGFCPVAKLHDQGINVALGTDGGASNNDLDLWGELRTAALVAKAVSNDASAVDAHSALRMATLNGAKALGQEQNIGSLIAGKSADICAVALSQLEQAPLYNVASQLVYTNSAARVSHLWVNGKMLLSESQLCLHNEQNIIARAQAWADKINPRQA